MEGWNDKCVAEHSCLYSFMVVGAWNCTCTPHSFIWHDALLDTIKHTYSLLPFYLLFNFWGLVRQVLGTVSASGHVVCATDERCWNVEN